MVSTLDKTGSSTVIFNANYNFRFHTFLIDIYLQELLQFDDIWNRTDHLNISAFPMQIGSWERKRDTHKLARSMTSKNEWKLRNLVKQLKGSFTSQSHMTQAFWLTASIRCTLYSVSQCVVIFFAPKIGIQHDPYKKCRQSCGVFQEKKAISNIS